MDAVLFYLVGADHSFKMDKFLADRSGWLIERGIDPVAYRWNRHIALLPSPIPQELSELAVVLGPNPKCYLMSGDFLRELEMLVNGWVDEDDAVDVGLDHLIEMLLGSAEASIFAYEPGGDRIDAIYQGKDHQWIYEKLLLALDRRQPLEGFVVVGRCAGTSRRSGSPISRP